MSLYRGAGGASDATDDSTVNAVAGYASSAASSATSAANSATAASTSASAAATSASGAATSASSVATNATNAASSASLAGTYATQASNSKDAAAASATTASTRAGEASSSASGASSSAATATTKAGEASTSATASAASAVDSAASAASALAIYGNTAAVNAAVAAAAASATTSTTQAANSAASAGDAADSESLAFEHEQNAAEWASFAQGSANSAQGYSTAALAARDATLAAYDSFDDRYLGVKNADPTLDNDGNTLIPGSLYFNSSTQSMKLYTGTAWVDAYVSGNGFLVINNNLSDLQSAATARTNLGLGTAATTNATAYATVAQGTNADTAFGWGNHASAGYAADSAVVKLTGDQTIAGTKTFSSTVAGSINGNAATATTATNVSGGTASVTTLTTSSTVTHNGGTANGVTYLNGSKVLTSGSVLKFDGTNLSIGQDPSARFSVSRGSNGPIASFTNGVDSDFYINGNSGVTLLTPTTPILAFGVSNAEQMRLTSTGLGIGTSSPNARLNVLDVAGGSNGTIWLGSATYYGTLKHDAGSTGSNIYNVATASGGGHLFQRGGTTQMTLDSSGNLGLGVTPSAWRSTYKASQVGNATAVVGRTDNNNNYFSSNWYVNASNQDIYQNTGFATLYSQGAGTHAWYTAPSGTAGNAITFTQAMTLDASGNLVVGGTSALVSASGRGNITVNGSSASILSFGIGGANSGYIFSSSGAFELNAIGERTMNFTVNGSERARIDSSGNLLVGGSSAAKGRIDIQAKSGSASTCLSIRGWGSGVGSAGDFTADNTLNSDVFYFNTSATNVGKIAITSTATSYVTSSDYRLKENIAPMTGALAKVAALKPVTYKWKLDGSNGEGFIAHELAEVCPQAVTGDKDSVDEEGKPQYQGIDVSFLVGTLTSAIQEQQALILTLQADVAALKAAA